MGLKAVINSLEEVPDAVRGFYEKVGDEYVLSLEDRDYKEKLSEFRNRNIDLAKKMESQAEIEKELETLRDRVKKYGDLDPEYAAEAVKKMQALEEKKLIDEGQLDEVVEQRIQRRLERMTSDYDGKIKALQNALEKAQGNENTYRTKLEDVVIDSSIQRAISNVAPVRKGAMEDLLQRAKRTWVLDENGNPIPKSGNEVIYGKDGKQPISMEEWGQSLLLEAPHLFEGNVGGGANGNSDTGGMRHGMIRLGDQEAIDSNIEAIAKGEVLVGSNN